MSRLQRPLLVGKLREVMPAQNIEEDSSCPVSGHEVLSLAIPDWEKILPQPLFALRTVIHDSTEFSPAELVHGKNQRTPVMLLYEKLTEEHVESSVLDYVFELINRMKRCQKLAILHMEDAKQKQKLRYDRRTVKRQFQPGELVLVIAPSRSNKLSVSGLALEK
ncbi:retrovirus-related Pol polyprotein from transposon 412 [Trichonephila clavipes]|nr:retrovirus-related Pol polyprotein from transposon 412 [Trichonephila clavipes]